MGQAGCSPLLPSPARDSGPVQPQSPAWMPTTCPAPERGQLAGGLQGVGSQGLCLPWGLQRVDRDISIGLGDTRPGVVEFAESCVHLPSPVLAWPGSIHSVCSPPLHGHSPLSGSREGVPWNVGAPQNREVDCQQLSQR